MTDNRALKDTGGGAGVGGGFRSGLVLNPMTQLVNRAKFARAMEPGCPIPDHPPGLLASMSPNPQVMEKASEAIKGYMKVFTFEKQEKKVGGAKRISFFSDIALPGAG
ncbi:unnamed protein product, partial [Discosporangium mesarthrocarpum]